MKTSYIARKVKAKLNLKKKLKELKRKLVKKKYKTLNVENAKAFAKDFGEEHYWKFDVKDDAKTSKGTEHGVPVIYVEIESDKDKGHKDHKELGVWFDPVIGELYGSVYPDKGNSTQHKFQFTPLTEESAKKYVEYILKDDDHIKVDTKSKVKKTKDQGIDMISVPIISDGDSYDFMVWYEPGSKSLYGEW